MTRVTNADIQCELADINDMSYQLNNNFYELDGLRMVAVQDNRTIYEAPNKRSLYEFMTAFRAGMAETLRKFYVTHYDSPYGPHHEVSFSSFDSAISDAAYEAVRIGHDIYVTSHGDNAVGRATPQGESYKNQDGGEVHYRSYTSMMTWWSTKHAAD